MSDWFRRGIANIDQIVGRNVHMTTPQLVRLRAGENKRLLILDDDLAMVAPMHRKKIHDRWCIFPCNDIAAIASEGEGCVMCKTDRPPPLRAPVTVVDLDGWTDGAGVVRGKYRRSVWLTNDQTAESRMASLDFLYSTRIKFGTLRGILVRATQIEATHNAIGDTFVAMQKYDIDKPSTAASLKATWKVDPELDPFDYSSFIRPMGNAMIKSILAGVPQASPQVSPEAKEPK